MYNSMCFRGTKTVGGHVEQYVFYGPFYLYIYSCFFIFQKTVHPRVLYFRKPFTPGFYISEKCSPHVFIFQRTVHPRFFIFQRIVHPRFLYFRELFTPGFYISENCSLLVFLFQRTLHPWVLVEFVVLILSFSV